MLLPRVALVVPLAIGAQEEPATPSGVVFGERPELRGIDELRRLPRPPERRRQPRRLPDRLRQPDELRPGEALDEPAAGLDRRPRRARLPLPRAGRLRRGDVLLLPAGRRHRRGTGDRRRGPPQPSRFRHRRQVPDRPGEGARLPQRARLERLLAWEGELFGTDALRASPLPRTRVADLGYPGIRSLFLPSVLQGSIAPADGLRPLVADVTGLRDDDAAEDECALLLWWIRRR